MWFLMTYCYTHRPMHCSNLIREISSYSWWQLPQMTNEQKEGLWNAQPYVRCLYSTPPVKGQGSMWKVGGKTLIQKLKMSSRKQCIASTTGQQRGQCTYELTCDSMCKTHWSSRLTKLQQSGGQVGMKYHSWPRFCWHLIATRWGKVFFIFSSKKSDALHVGRFRAGPIPRNS